MNLMNRKLFRSRNARDKLNKMGGIMSSSQPLMQTVQKFQVGGSIYANQPSMLTSIRDFLRTGDSQSGIGQIQNQNAMMRAGVTPDDLQRVRAQVTPEDLARVQAATKANILANAAERTSNVQIPTGDNTAQIENINAQLSDLGGLMTDQQKADSEAMRSRLEETQTMSYPDEALRAMGAGERTFAETSTLRDSPAAAQSNQNSQDLIGDDLSVEPSTAPPAVGDAPARTPAEDVQKVFNEGSETEVKDQLQSLMDEFTSKAPKFEGMNKGLALAKIGFAMAAGQSPDAITNIATALNQGADMFIKDKKDREAFDRQVKLSGLKYGLTEIGKQRAEKRVAEREGRKLKTFIADDAVTIDGKKYGKGDLVPVPISYIRENGLPSELTTPELVKAAQERVSATNKQISDLIKEGTLSNKDARAEAELYQNSAQNVAGAETAIGLLENSLVDVAEGKVTGLAPAFRNIVRQGGSFFGIDMGSEFKDVDEARASMRFALQEAIPLTVGSAQSANSISDRDVDLLITALFGQDALTGGPFVFATEDADLMGQRLQRAIGEIRRGQQNELANMESVETRLANMYAPGSSTATGVIPATRQLDPFRRNLEQAGFTVGGRPTRTTAGLVLSGEEDGIPVYDFSAQ